jgi:hypothetical protein
LTGGKTWCSSIGRVITAVQELPFHCGTAKPTNYGIIACWVDNTLGSMTTIFIDSIFIRAAKSIFVNSF